MTEYRYASERPTVAIAPTLRRATKAANPIIVGYAAVFNRETMIGSFFREQIARGAFTDAIGRDDVRGLFNYDASWLLGRSSAGTLRLSQDAHGLRYEIDVDPKDPIAMSIVSKVRRGDISGSSFAFTVHEDDERCEYTKGRVPPLRTVLRATLIDVSPVTLPMRPQPPLL